MPPLHLGLEVVCGVVRGELPQFLGQHQLPRQVEQEVGHLLADRGRVPLPQRVVELVDLLHQVRAEGDAGLDLVPRAPVPKVGNHRHGARKR